MAYTEITRTLILSGKALKDTLLARLRDNFVDHESRIAALESRIANIPTGVIIPNASSVLPAGWLACDGSAVSRTTYAALFAVLGGASSPYGLGNGTTTFNLPDSCGRALMGSGTGSGLSPRSRGEKPGAEAEVLSISHLPIHNHTIQNDSHNHGYGTAITFVSGGVHGVTNYYNNASAPGSSINVALATSGYNGTTTVGSSSGHNNMQPFVVAMMIIKT